MRAMQRKTDEPRYNYPLPRYSYEREKGLFPFKGKGGLLKYMDQMEEYAAHLEQAAHDFTQRHNTMLKQYGINLTPHTESKRGYRVPMVRWRNLHDRTMGMPQFDRVIRQVHSEGERRMLYEVEVERCLLNNQAGTVNTTMRRLKTTLESLEHAEEMLKAGPGLRTV